MKFLIRLSPEVSIKSRQVRQQQTRQLRQNIRKIVARMDFNILVESLWDRIDVTVPPDSPVTREQMVDTLSRISGISNVQLIDEYTLESLAQVTQVAVAAFQPLVKGKTFAVRTKRIGTHSFTSKDVEQAVGAQLMASGEPAGVDLKAPELQLRIEIKGDLFLIGRERFEGMGGYPMGSIESSVCLLSGGYDSSVAAYLTMRRGIRTHFLFFNLGGMAHEAGVKQVAWYLWDRYASSHRVKFISVPFEGVVTEIMRSVNNRHWGVVLKRMMLKAASEIAESINAPALVKGDAVAQVASQTLTNLNVVDRASDTVVLRPLIAMDKVDIIRLATEIGTEPFARNMPEYCGVISDKPVTRGRLYRIEQDEANMDPAALQAALDNRVETPIDQIMDTVQTVGDVELVATPTVGDVIIDIRHPNEQERSPLTLTNNRILHIPFYELAQQQSQLDARQRYLLYCDRGTMSRLHAANLKAEGLDNVLVYAPELNVR
ncbi:MAG: tRNA 4-thiouridine(8) synthase ThiI [Marinobacter sp.]|nr:tRNA 4-thiouridine(8) synthase ThiI [Marinobacter sp.]